MMLYTYFRGDMKNAMVFLMDCCNDVVNQRGRSVEGEGEFADWKNHFAISPRHDKALRKRNIGQWSKKNRDGLATNPLIPHEVRGPGVQQ